MFKFKKNFPEFSKDLDEYLDSLNLESELKKMNVLPSRVESIRERSLGKQLNDKEIDNTNTKNNDISKK